VGGRVRNCWGWLSVGGTETKRQGRDLRQGKNNAKLTTMYAAFVVDPDGKTLRGLLFYRGRISVRGPGRSAHTFGVGRAKSNLMRWGGVSFREEFTPSSAYSGREAFHGDGGLDAIVRPNTILFSVVASIRNELILAAKRGRPV